MGFSSYAESIAEGNRNLLETRTCVTVKKSSKKISKRKYTIIKERFSEPKELQQSTKGEKCVDQDEKTITKSRSLDKTFNANKLDGRKVITHKSCDGQARTNSQNSSKASNQCQRKLRDANRRLLELEHAIDNDIKILKQNQLSLSKIVATSKIKLNANEPYFKEHRHEEGKHLPLKPKTRTVGSQISVLFDKNGTDWGAFGDHNSKNKTLFKAVVNDEAPTAKGYITNPLVNGDYDQLVNICYGCSQPYPQCIASGECRTFVCSPQGYSRGSECAPRHEEYYYVNPQMRRNRTQNCYCSQGHNSQGYCYNCCQCKEKLFQKSKSYKRRTTDLNTQQFYYRKSESRTSCKSSSPDKSKSIKHQKNCKLVQNKEKNIKSKEAYKEQELTRKPKMDDEHLKDRRKTKNESEKSTSEVSEKVRKILIETLGEERVCKLIHMLDHCTEESDKSLNEHKNETKQQLIVYPSGPGTFHVASKERVYEISSYKQKPVTNSSTSPRFYSPDSSHESQYPLETLRMLGKMKIKEYKAITPTANGKIHDKTNRQREEIIEKNSIHRSQDKDKRYHEYIQKYKSHDISKNDETIQTEKDTHQTYTKDVNDTFAEQLYAYGADSSGFHDYKKEADVFKKREHFKSKHDFTGPLTDGTEKIKHITGIEHTSATTRRFQDLVGNEEKPSYTFSKENRSRDYKGIISSMEPKNLNCKTEIKGCFTGSKKHTTEKPQNVQRAGNNDDNKVNVPEKRKVNSIDDMEYHYASEKSVYDLNLSMVAQDMYEKPRTYKDYKGNQEDHSTSKFLTDNRHHINTNDYYTNGIQSESGIQGLFRGNRRHATQVNNIKTETPQYYNTNGNSTHSRVQDVTEEIKTGRSYIISSESRDAKNECEGINNTLERNYADGTPSHDLFKLQNKSQDIVTATTYREATTGNNDDTMSKAQSSIEDLKTLVNYELTDDMHNTDLLKIKVSRDKGTLNDATKSNNEEPSSTSQSIYMEKAKEAMNQHFAFDNNECDRSSANLSPNKITKDKDTSVESFKLEDAEGSIVLDQYSTVFQFADCNSSLDTLRCLRDLLNLYQTGTLEDENLKALAEEISTNLSRNYSNSRDNYRASEDKSTLTWQQVLGSGQETVEGSTTEKVKITTTEVVKSAESIVTNIPSYEKVVDRLKAYEDTIFKPDSRSSLQDVSATNLKKCWPIDIKLKSAQDLNTKISSSNGSFKISSAQSKAFSQEGTAAITEQCEIPQVLGCPEPKQQMITHRTDENADNNLTSPPHSHYSYNKPEEKTICEQNIATGASAETKFNIPRKKPSGNPDDVREQFPPSNVENKDVNHMEPQPEELVCEESLTRETDDIIGNSPSDNVEYVYKQYPSTNRYINFKPTEYTDTQSESHFEYFEVQEDSNVCENHISDIPKTPKPTNYISTKVSNDTQHDFNNPSSSRVKNELAHCASSSPLKSILKSCHTRHDLIFKETAAHLQDTWEYANRSNSTSIQASSISCPLSEKVANSEFEIYQTTSTVKVGTKEQSLEQKYSTKTYYTDEEIIVNFSHDNGQRPLCQDDENNNSSTCNYTQTTIENPTWSSNLPLLRQDKITNHLSVPGELLNTSKQNVPTFQHCPCMLNTYINLLKTYYKTNKRPILSESSVNC